MMQNILCVHARAAPSPPFWSPHLYSVSIAAKQLQQRSHRRSGCTVTEGELLQRGRARQGEGGSNPGGGGRARVVQAEGVVQAGPTGPISHLRGSRRG